MIYYNSGVGVIEKFQSQQCPLKAHSESIVSRSIGRVDNFVHTLAYISADMVKPLFSLIS